MFKRVFLLVLLSFALCVTARASVFPQSPSPAQNLISVNLLQSPDDVRLACTVLQGLVNRKQPRIYIIQNPSWHTAEVIPKWIEGIKAKGHTFTEVSDPLTLFATFKSSVKGAVLYESDLADKPQSLHKLNALTLYCALNDTVPVTENLNAKLKLPVVFDAAAPPADRPDRMKLKGLTVLFAVGDENADARIEALIAAHSAPRSLTVVSTDLRVRQAAQRRRARAVTSDEYLTRLSGGRKGQIELPTSKPTAEEVARSDGLSASEAAYWLAEFADLADEPKVREGLRAADFVPTDAEIARIEREVRDEVL